nr:unnamed protein product [Digitaria exilis]
MLHAGANPGAALVSKLCTSETVLKPSSPDGTWYPARKKSCVPTAAMLRQSPELKSRFATATIWFGGTSSCHIPGRISHMPLEQWNTSAELRSSADDCSMVMDMVVVPPGVRRGSPLEAANVLSANPPTTWKLPCHVTPTHL